MTAEPVSDPERAYFGTDPSRYAERSSLQGLLATKIPLMITSPPNSTRPALCEQLELFKDGPANATTAAPHSFMLPQHSHMSEVYSINTADTRLTGEILDFVKSGKIAAPRKARRAAVSSSRNADAF